MADRKPTFIGTRAAFVDPDFVVVAGPGVLRADGTLYNPKLADGRGWHAMETWRAVTKDNKARVTVRALLATSDEESPSFRPGRGYRRADLRHDVNEDRRFGQLLVLCRPEEADKIAAEVRAMVVKGS